MPESLYRADELCPLCRRKRDEPTRSCCTKCVPIAPEKSYQVVTLTLHDGRRVSYSGQAQIEDGEQVLVIGIEVTPGEPLPRGMIWDKLAEVKP